MDQWHPSRVPADARLPTLHQAPPQARGPHQPHPQIRPPLQASCRLPPPPLCPLHRHTRRRNPTRPRQAHALPGSSRPPSRGPGTTHHPTQSPPLPGAQRLLHQAYRGVLAELELLQALYVHRDRSPSAWSLLTQLLQAELL